MLGKKAMAYLDRIPAEEGGGSTLDAATPTCMVVRPAKMHTSTQGLPYFEGISAESVGARGICMHLLTISPGGRAKAHLHAHHETAIYVLSGASEVWYGEDLQGHLVTRAGDFLYIPA